MDFFDLLAKSWPMILALITLIIVLSKLDLRVAVLEEKTKQLFDLWNRRKTRRTEPCNTATISARLKAAAMFELLGGGILGSLLGGMFRLAPEVMKFLDKGSERRHELQMFERQCDLEKLRGQIKLGEIAAQRDLAIDAGAMGALQAAIAQQSEMVKAAGGWVASLSASVRPMMTYYLLALYGAAKVAAILLAVDSGQHIAEVMARAWSVDDMALLSGVVNYWILDRTLAKRGLA
jgi:hypothetical protein